MANRLFLRVIHNLLRCIEMSTVTYVFVRMVLDHNHSWIRGSNQTLGIFMSPSIISWGRSYGPIIITDICFVAPCYLVDVYRRLNGNYCLHKQNEEAASTSDTAQ